jgi:Flp pilus assembly protein TadD
MEARLQRVVAEMPARLAEPESGNPSMDAAERQRLASLGYLSGGGVGVPADGRRGPDPKTRIPIIRKVAEITQALQQGQSAVGIARLRSLLQEHPDSTFAAVALADALAGAGRHGEASEVLAKLVAAVPGDPQARLYLGISLMNQRRIAQAKEQFLAALALFPDLAPAEEKLAIALAMTGDVEGARRHMERAVELAPSLPEAQLNLGLLYLQLGDEKAAEERFRLAIELRAGYQLARQRLADLLEKQGRTDEARQVLRDSPGGS